MYVQKVLLGHCIMIELRLLHFQLCQQLQKPLEGALFFIDPKEIHFAEAEIWGEMEVFRPSVSTIGTLPPGLPIPVHDRLKDGGERGNTDPCGNQNCVVHVPEDSTAGGTIGAVNENFQGRSHRRMRGFGTSRWTTFFFSSKHDRCRSILQIGIPGSKNGIERFSQNTFSAWPWRLVNRTNDVPWPGWRWFLPFPATVLQRFYVNINLVAISLTISARCRFLDPRFWLGLGISRER